MEAPRDSLLPCLGNSQEIDMRSRKIETSVVYLILTCNFKHLLTLNSPENDLEIFLPFCFQLQML